MKEKENKFLIKLGDFIVTFRYLFLILFLAIGVFACFNLNKTKINYDITSYLPSKSETKKGLDLMEQEFGSLNGLELMINNVSIEEATSIYQDLSSLENIDSISFSNTKDFYKDNKALYIINMFDIEDSEKDTIKSSIIDKVSDKEYYLYDDSSDDVVGGMNLILILAIIIIIIVLIITSKSYFDIVLAFIVFGISILINMGTNYIFDSISFITNSIAIILQLGLSLDYLIIFLNHYEKEIDDTDDVLLAVKKTVSKAIPEVCASSLTTIAGLMALVFMQLKIGADIGIVLSKGIVCSLLTVILFLPALLVLFNKVIKKGRHKNLVPDATRISTKIVNGRKVILPVFIVLMIFAVFMISKYNYVYNIDSVKSYQLNENAKNKETIINTFGNNNQIVVLIKNSEKDYSKELDLVNKLKENKSIKSLTSLGSINLSENLYLGTKLNYQELARVLNIDSRLTKEIYNYYALNKKITVEDLKISIIDTIYFLHEAKIDLPEQLEVKLNTYYENINNNKALLESSNYTRIIIETNSEVESEETFALINEIRSITKDFYDEVTLVGNSINAKDLKYSFTHDNIIITFITILFIAIILLFTFKSFSISAILILAIEGSIMLNFGLASLFGINIFFISYIIVSAIQMGATIDYAIVVTNRYTILRKKMNKKEALIGTLKDTISTIITSGLILTIAGFLIGFISDAGVVSSIGMFLGTGTLISLIVTIFVLPTILYVLDKIVSKKENK